MKASISDVIEQEHQRLDILFELYQLQREHHDIAVGLFDSYHLGMKEHLRLEEQYIYIKLEQHPKFHNKLVSLAILRQEHQQILICLNNLRRFLQLQQTIEAITQEQTLMRLLSIHNMKEDTTLYPVCDRLFNDAELALILQQIQFDSAA